MSGGAFFGAGLVGWRKTACQTGIATRVPRHPSVVILARRAGIQVFRMRRRKFSGSPPRCGEDDNNGNGGDPETRGGARVLTV